MLPLSVTDAVAKVRGVQRDERTAAINTLIAGASDDESVLQWRALFITALREAEV